MVSQWMLYLDNVDSLVVALGDNKEHQVEVVDMEYYWYSHYNMLGTEEDTWEEGMEMIGEEGMYE